MVKLPVRCDPAEVIGAVIAERLGRLARCGIRLCVWIEPTVPVAVGLDPGKLVALLHHLIDHAVRARDCGALHIRLSADTVESASWGGAGACHQLMFSVSGDDMVPTPLPPELATMAAALAATPGTVEVGMSGRAGWGASYWVMVTAPAGDQEPAAGMPLIEAGILDQMRRDISPALVVELVRAFALDILDRCAAVTDAVIARDPPTALRHCHAIAGASGTFGALRLEEIASRAETAYHAGDLAAAMALAMETAAIGRQTAAALAQGTGPA